MPTNLYWQNADLWLPEEGQGREGWRERLQKDIRGGEYAHYPDCNDGVPGVYTCQMYQTVHFKYVQSV